MADVHREGISDLAVEDRKVGGSCVYRARDLLYCATTLLCDPALGAIERYLRHPPREPEYRRGRKHRDFLGSLAALADEWNRDCIDAQGRALERILSADLTRLRES